MTAKGKCEMLQAPRGTQDIYGDDMKIWRYIEDRIRAITDAYNFTEIRVPIFEHTELFLRGNFSQDKENFAPLAGGKQGRYSINASEKLSILALVDY